MEIVPSGHLRAGDKSQTGYISTDEAAASGPMSLCDCIEPAESHDLPDRGGGEEVSGQSMILGKWRLCKLQLFQMHVILHWISWLCLWLIFLLECVVV